MTPPNVAVYDWIRRGFDFKGRSSRSDYWWPRLLVLTLNVVLLFVFLAGLNIDQTEHLLEWLGEGSMSFDTLQIGWSDLPVSSRFSLVFAIVFGLLTLIPDISLSWRRFQDMGRPGWMHLLFLVAGGFIMFATIVEFIWFARPGTEGSNRYGPDPQNRWPSSGG
jgi:uncharacterized membrane protein YhaH (DUF805 family)